MILLYNRVRARANAELDVLLDESEIDCILRGEHRDVAPEVVELVEKEAQEFVNDLLSGLRERMLELKSGRVIFLGGGASLLRRQIEAEKTRAASGSGGEWVKLAALGCPETLERGLAAALVRRVLVHADGSLTIEFRFRRDEASCMTERKIFP